MTITMTKPRSPLLVTFAEDAGDSHFCNVTEMRKKTGATVRTHYILMSDLQTWIDVYAGQGFGRINGK
jgi:hypothetical protein